MSLYQGFQKRYMFICILTEFKIFILNGRYFHLAYTSNEISI